MKQSKNSFIANFKFFYSFLGVKIFIGLLLSIFVGLLDGFGLAMFLPLLQVIDASELASSEGLGGLQFITDFINYLGFQLSVNVVLVVIAILFILKGIFKFIEGYYVIIIQQLFVLKIRTQCIDHISNISYKAFVKTDAGKIQNTLSTEVIRIITAYRTFFGTIQYGVFIAVYLILAFISNMQFAFTIFVIGALTSFMFLKIYSKTKNLSSSVTSYGHTYQGLLIQFVDFFKYLKSTSRIESYSKKLKEAVSSLEQSNKEMGLIQSFLQAVREPLVIVIVLLVIVLQIHVFNQDIKLIVLSLLFFYRALNYLVVFQTQWNSYLSVSGSVANIKLFLEFLKQNKEQYGAQKLTEFKQSLAFQNVSFGYKPDDYIIKNINININKNETVAFVGESGSGKTTLVNLISGLIAISEGIYTIDTVNVKDIDIRTFQHRIGYINQDPIIFNDNVFNNVTFWDEKTPQNVEKFWKAIEKAFIADFVSNLPLKEDEQLGNNGVMISGGQKQRLSIARELYKDIDILIMDEATSALDSQTELYIKENIDLLKGNLTIILIAHRLSTIKNADVIYLLEKGEVVASGTFEQLQASNQKFKNLVKLQGL